jgi:DNA-binding response OmpR family regulator
LLKASPAAFLKTAHVTPWVLLVLTDPRERRSAQEVWEGAGFGVEIASSVEDALELMAVMTPSLVVTDDRLYRPAPR